jgi:hypothetical protein
VKLQLHSQGAHRTPTETHHKPLANMLGKAERSSDYLIVGLIVVLGLAMVVGLLTASGVNY